MPLAPHIYTQRILGIMLQPLRVSPLPHHWLTRLHTPSLFITIMDSLHSSPVIWHTLSMCRRGYNIFRFVCFRRPMSYPQCCLCLWIVNSSLDLWLSLMIMIFSVYSCISHHVTDIFLKAVFNTFNPYQYHLGKEQINDYYLT